MRLVATVEATVTYACYLSEEDSQKVINYIGDTDLSLEDAVHELYSMGDINLYANSEESDFSTDKVTQVEEVGAV